ncbi:putative 4-coumarate--CoA ligase 1 [Cladophialophora carrionii]|uniref:Putative 4-coumarate--CoA ligase 1 n=1 Tax=Cladophialophora carrionii TaxID=86049 RepID=A0A1C1CDG0_9EURO|nr:putative 4-coumarate--CoA ligase 1 [Cladophialophora carrionii]
MPIESAHPPITVPPVDVWDFLFEPSDREFPEDHVVFVDVAAQQQQSVRDVRDAATRFGRGMRQQWHWHKGDVLAMFSPNSTDIAAVTFGTLWAGGVVCPFNNLYTVGELASQLKSSQAKALVTHVACLEVAREAALLVGLSLDRVILVGSRDPKERFKHFSDVQASIADVQRVHVDPKEDLAYLVYSSGTTGLPKGVMLTHENIVANMLQAAVMDAQQMHWTKDSTVGFLPMYHIYGIAVLLLQPVFRGVRVYIMQRFELEPFCRLIQHHRITFACVVPPVVLALAKHPLVDKYNLSSLRMMHSSAAPLTADLVQMVYRRLKVPIKQGYGLSEASPGVASQSWSEWNKTVGSAGTLLPSISLKCVADGIEVPFGESGEIWIKGPNVFKGYYKNPQATAESISPDGWYRTGDVGHVDNDHNLHITDRVKELIKYNGFQVAPAQLEGLLLAHPAVNDVAVIGVYSREKATELPRAYVVAAKGYTAGPELEGALSAWLNNKVAPYKRLRGGIRFVDAIPKSNAGKVLRRVLSEQAKKKEESVRL